MTIRVVLLLSVLAGVPSHAQPVFCDSKAPQVSFGAAEIRRVLGPKAPAANRAIGEIASDSSPLRFVLAADAAESKALAQELGVAPLKVSSSQSYAIRRQERRGRLTIAVLAADPVGAMYGAFDIAEGVRLGTIQETKDSDHSPRIAQRGIKFNITLDRRTPTYSDNSDSSQANIPEVWRMEFWHTYFDEMARQRFNVISLWSLHPFPSLVKVPEFPDVALNDVWGNTEPFDLQFNMDSSVMAQPFRLGKVAIVNRMTIDEKIRFWREVLQYGKDRGIDVYWFTWNIFVWGTEGKHGLTEDGRNEATIAYFRASVREMVKTYPLLAGVGITAGENMKTRQGTFDHEDWLWRTYGEGIRDGLKDQPNRQFRLIHRYHQTAQGRSIEAFKEYPGPFDFSFKYSVAHMYSETKPPFIAPVLEQMPKNMRTWLTVRNDDIYSYRWGDPDFAREYLRNIPGPDRVAGFYMGPDGYSWGREFIDKEPETPRQLVMQKQWYSFAMWGRLSYEPELPNALFERMLAARFPGIPASKLYQAVAAASKTMPQVTRFFWRDLDFLWFPEGNIQKGNGNGFFTVADFIKGQTMPESGNLNVRQWRSRFLKGATMGGTTPLQVAEALKTNAAASLRMVSELRPLQPKSSKEFRLTLGDAEAMAELGNYYADKILAATELALFDGESKPEHRDAAVKHLEAALVHWKAYAAVATSQYKPQFLGRLVRVVDLNALTAAAAADITLAREWQPGTIKDDGEGPIRGDTNFRQ
ncbi:MAG: carbohydrate-binding family 6 protein [Candidatus Solibacter sp.]